MNETNAFQGEMDPEIAALLGTAVSPPTDVLPPSPDSSSPALADAGREALPPNEAIELSGSFPEITKKFEDTPNPAFSDPAYYKTALSGEGDIAQRLHGILQRYLNAKDPADRGVFRQQIIPVYWDFLLGVAKKAAGEPPDPKKFLLRFGILHPSFLGPEDRELFSKIVMTNEYSEPVYYLDEWFRAIGNGKVRVSTTDEVGIVRANASARMKQLLDKAVGKRDGAKSLLKAKDGERMKLEEALREGVARLTEHRPIDEMPDVHSLFSEAQKNTFTEVQNVLKQMYKADHDLAGFIKEYDQAAEDVQVLTEKVEAEGGSAGADTQAVDTEFGTIRQMSKMTIGRQGNHFPLLTKEYFHCMPQDLATRENIITRLKWVESIDPQAFCRVYKNKLNRIVPYVILIPGYGDTGICWEPFDRYNRATSRGRIAVPMYSKNLTLALLAAVGDLRWQNAKEKASFYWMEDGLTGNYYQWFAAKKFKGDVKEFFINDYILWMTKESEGTQKLDKEVRGVFWRYMPFTQDIKEKLKGRSLAYLELYQRDLNRAKSRM
ncbi:hypothetical protein AGMMS49940_12440 [Spirochaetia bacterium]|nr:hypothetical protein AGMMS49940_12440 [Spirochaetia bacterium]